MIQCIAKIAYKCTLLYEAVNGNNTSLLLMCTMNITVMFGT